MNIDFSGFDNFHLLGENALPARPVTTCSGAFNYRF
jgi:hypothetical protein